MFRVKVLRCHLLQAEKKAMDNYSKVHTAHVDGSKGEGTEVSSFAG